MTDLATVGEVGVWGEPVAVWVRPNGIDKFGVAYFGETCPPGWVATAKPYYTRPLSSFPKTENVEPSVSTSAQVEPVAWMHKQGNYEEPSLIELDDHDLARGWEQYPLYTRHQPASWVGLTNEELLEASKIAEKGNYLVAFQRIQQKLKEKNA